MKIPLQKYRSLLATYFAPYWRIATLLGILLLGGVVLRLINPEILKNFIDLATSGGSMNDLLTQGAWFLGSAMVLQIVATDIPTLEKGLDTQVGPRGTKLSGGQVQRAAAARMFVRKPELLVFDDLSSALDVETEQLLWDRLDEASGRVEVAGRGGWHPRWQVVGYRWQVGADGIRPFWWQVGAGLPRPYR